MEIAPVEYTQGGFSISTDPSKLQLNVIHEFLKNAYWCKNIPRALVQKAIAHSLCYGIYEGTQQVGFARVITDFATYAYLSDVFVLESHRGRGLSKWLMTCIQMHPDLQGLRRWTLATRDAHGLYSQFGFYPLKAPERWMEISDSDIYLR
ncbi:MAG: GNAT family N-acetyltransferase [Chloroflexi bacterium]|nr:GNAT family N-acetyltransferase [Chloroflexota bacterium]